MNYSNDFNGQQRPPSSVDNNEVAANADHTIQENIQAIENNIKTVSEAVLERRGLDRSGPKVMLCVGELHENGLHVIQQIGILNALQENGLNCATALEWPANNIDLHIKEIFKSETTDKTGLVNMLEAEDNRSLRNSLSADTTPIRSANARLSRALLHEFMDDRHIPAFCTDAPRDWDLFIQNQRKFQHLHINDPKVAEAVNEAFSLLNISNDAAFTPPVDSLRQLGMLARNIYIMNEADRILHENNEIDVVLIEAGRAHVTGNDTLKPEASPYEHSMSSLATKHSGHAFIGAPLYASQDDRMQNTSPQALTDPKIIELSYLEKAPFNTTSSKTSDLKEAEKIKKLSAYFPFISETLRGRSPKGLYEERRDELKKNLRDLRDNNGFTLTAPDPYIPT